LQTAGFVTPVHDVLRQRSSRLTLSDPIVRFYNAIMWRYLPDLEERRAAQVWEASAETFRAQVLGPHFEQLAREWTARFSAHEGVGEPVGAVGHTVVNDAAGRSRHEIDVVALAAGEPLFAKEPRVLLLGEAKYNTRPRTINDLRRLEHLRALLVGRGVRAESAKLAIFARSADEELRRAAATRDDVLVLSLAELYASRPASDQTI
jgi:hypothetical protein